jgi:hypothetical protein
VNDSRYFRFSATLGLLLAAGRILIAMEQIHVGRSTYLVSETMKKLSRAMPHAVNILALLYRTQSRKAILIKSYVLFDITVANRLHNE